jgi:hypothetical protein
VPAPKTWAANPITGDGWTLDLKPGWRVAPVKGSKDFAVIASSR